MLGIELSLQNQFVKFLMVGTVGFIVDTSVLYLGIYLLGMDYFSGRLLSYLVAATVTWYLHRHFTFQVSDTAKRLREWFHFLLANAIGGVINFGLYSAVILYGTEHYLTPLIGIFFGSIAGLAFNFIASKTFVFKTKV